VLQILIYEERRTSSNFETTKKTKTILKFAPGHHHYHHPHEERQLVFNKEESAQVYSGISSNSHIMFDHQAGGVCFQPFFPSIAAWMDYKERLAQAL
jgi:hypothetical protein